MGQIQKKIKCIETFQTLCHLTPIPIKIFRSRPPSWEVKVCYNVSPLRLKIDLILRKIVFLLIIRCVPFRSAHPV